MAKVLIVEDDEIIGQGMARHLAAAGFDPLWVTKGEQGLARLRYERPDVCVLDLMIPQTDGWSIIEAARGDGIGTPIIVVSARGTEHDRIHALEIGADDYLVKPFSMKELVARVQAAARRGVRAQEPARGEPIEIEELRIDPDQVEAYVDGDADRLEPVEHVEPRLDSVERLGDVEPPEHDVARPEREQRLAWREHGAAARAGEGDVRLGLAMGHDGEAHPRRERSPAEATPWASKW